MNKTTSHLTDDQLAGLALGYANTEVSSHLNTCDVCRVEVGVYRSIIQSTREVFCDTVVPVTLVSCEQAAYAGGSRCEAIDPVQHLHISLTRVNGMLMGQVTDDEDYRDHWQDSPVRLFDREGLVSSGQLGAGGDFSLAVPDSGGRFSLGLVLTRQGTPELRIVGHIRRA